MMAIRKVRRGADERAALAEQIKKAVNRVANNKRDALRTAGGAHPPRFHAKLTAEVRELEALPPLLPAEDYAKAWDLSAEQTVQFALVPELRREMAAMLTRQLDFSKLSSVRVHQVPCFVCRGGTFYITAKAFPLARRRIERANLVEGQATPMPAPNTPLTFVLRPGGYDEWCDIDIALCTECAPARPEGCAECGQDVGCSCWIDDDLPEDYADDDVEVTA